MVPNIKPITDRLLIPHSAFEIALRRVQQSYLFSARKAEAEGLAIVGESGTGKTSILRSLLEEHEPVRLADGMQIPVLFVTVPSNPTKKGLAGVILEALHAPDPHKGTAEHMNYQIRVLMRETGVLIVLIDEFQHFFDRGKQKIMHDVTDWLKILIDDTRVSIIVAGLPTCLGVIDANEQLARRFASPIRLKRFNWELLAEREEFIAVLNIYYQEFAQRYDAPKFSTEEMAFRFWVATGGLMGYVANILRQVERNALIGETRIITLHDLHIAHMEAVWAAQRMSDLPQPFLTGDISTPTIYLLRQGLRVGTIIPLPENQFSKRRRTLPTESLDSLLTK